MKTNTWIVVAGKDSARIFDKGQFSKSWENVNLVERQELDPDHSFKSIGHAQKSGTSGSRGLVDEESANRRIYGHYFQELCEFINKSRAQNLFQHLFLVAGPDTLGEIKNHLDKETLKHIKKNIAKDLVHLNKHELEEYMKDDFLFYGDLHK